MDLRTLLQNNGVEESAIGKLETAISKHINDGFVAKQLYKGRLAEVEAVKNDLQTANNNLATAEEYKQKYETEIAAKETAANETLKALGAPR